LINVPYVSQEREHYSGAACASMLGLFYQRNLPSQDVIMDILGARDYRNLKHETFEVLLSDFFAQHAQLLPAHYSANESWHCIYRFHSRHPTSSVYI
jgi:hypothetical protein